MMGQPLLLRSRHSLATNTLTEKIGMGSCVNHEKHQFCVELFPNEQPVRLDMTFPCTGIFTY